MSKQTAAASKIDCNRERAVLMMSMELGESGWLLGFASAFGQKPLRRKVATRDGQALMAQIAWAKQQLGLASDAPAHVAELSSPPHDAPEAGPHEAMVQIPTARRWCFYL